MSILETFYIIFKSNSSDVKKGSEEAKKTTEELNVSLKSVRESSDQVGDSFVGMGQSLLGVAATLVSVGSLLGNLRDAYTYTLQLDRASQALNVNASELDAWGRAVQKTGGTAQSFQQSLKNFGISTNTHNEDAIQLLLQLSDVFKKAGAEKSIRFGEKLGLDQSLILLMLKGSEAVRTMVREQRVLGVETQANTKLVEDFNSKWLDTSNSFKAMWISVLTSILPSFDTLNTKFSHLAFDYQHNTDLMKENSDLLKGALLGLSAVIIGFSVAAIGAATIAFVGMGLAIGAVVTAITLLYAKTNIIGAVFDGIKERIEAVVEAFKIMKDFFSNGKNIKPDEPTFEFVDEGNKQMNTYAQHPLTSQSSNSIYNSGLSNNNSASIQTGPITINTQSSNPEDVGNSLASHLRDQLRHATSSFDDAVAS